MTAARQATAQGRLVLLLPSGVVLVDSSRAFLLEYHAVGYPCAYGFVYGLNLWIQSKNGRRFGLVWVKSSYSLVWSGL